MTSELRFVDNALFLLADGKSTPLAVVNDDGSVSLSRQPVERFIADEVLSFLRHEAATTNA